MIFVSCWFTYGEGDSPRFGQIASPTCNLSEVGDVEFVNFFEGRTTSGGGFLVEPRVERDEGYAELGGEGLLAQAACIQYIVDF